LNCGACGTKCGPTAHCAGSTCECNQAGFTFCNGTCYDLQNDDKHCGACGTACSGSYSCDAGQCTCPLPTVGAEVQVTADIRTHVSLAAAWDGTHVGVAYVRMFPQAHYNVYFALLNPDGTLFSNKAVTAYPNTTLGVEPFTVGLVWTGTEYGVAWTQDITPAGMGSHDSIMHRRIKPDGSFVAAATMIADSGFSSFFTIGSALAWSSSYGGYGIAYAHGSYNQIGFQRWVPGQSPGPEQLFVMLGDPAQTQMAAAPDGTWGLAGAYGGLDLSIRNADGTSSDPVEHLRAATVPNFDEPALVHDGTTWLTAMGTPSATAGKTDVSINRGAVLNSPAKLLTSTANRSYLGATLSMVSGTVALLSAYTEGPAADKLLALQRYALPTDNSSNVRPIHDPVIISPTKRLARDFAIVTTGKSSLLAVWIDGRDSTPELYAAPVDLHACP
jgi:hypothetical protein